MLNRRLHRIIVGGITGIVLFSIAGAWLLVSETSFTFAFLCLLCIVALAIILAKEMEKTNRQLDNFFNAIRNNDYTVHFTGKKGDKFLNGLYEEMNRITAQFEGNRAELAERQLYYESIIRVLTHEIRNSITPIASLSADLVKYTGEYGKEGVIDGLQTIHQQAQQLHTFLNAYHHLTHLPDPVKENVEIAGLFRKLERLLCAEPGSDRIRYVSPEHLEIRLDPHLTTLALINLIRNALQATADHPAAEIRVEAGREATFSFLQVTDNGDGILQERLEDIFVPFYSTRQEGSGIGLPLSRRIMQLHGGLLTVDSVPGKQTLFRMSFPD
ncbi:HAMP domain-containing histidine kinase [Parabacteroides sp. OttesenSCG-928-K15]|nr:HAMP domain-containing histidine kinase [Parabacteroides sp. OttesenSCG-928-K15]